MDSITPALAGQKGLRADILVELKKAQPLTAKELAKWFGVTANAVRRHLKELEAEGLIEYDREQRGMGAPTYAFRLTDDGESLFPTQYDAALTDVLSYVAKTSGREAVREMFAKRFRPQAERLQAELADATIERKAEAIVEFFSEQGFMAESALEGGVLTISERNCAMRHVVEQFPEICAAELDFMKAVLHTDVQRDSYIPEGCNACRYTIPVNVSLPETPEAANVPHQE